MSKNMGSPLSPKERERYENYLREHEPYPDDAPEMNMLDGQWNTKRGESRVNARLIKKLLDLDDKIRSEK